MYRRSTPLFTGVVMKNFVSALLLGIFVFTTGPATFAQKRNVVSDNTDRVFKDRSGKGDFVSITKVEAFTEGNGVLVRWQTASEKANFGFYVHRIDANHKILASQQLIPGAAMKAGSDPLIGGTYELFDEAGGIDSNYYIECLSLDGRRISTVPVSSTYSDDLKMATGHSREDLTSKKRVATGNIEMKRLSMPKDLNTETRASQALPDLTNQRWVVSQPGAKIAVRQEGIYRVTRAELLNAGFDLSTDPAFWRLFTDGNEQAIQIGGNGDYIEFYGTGIDTVESDTRMYYLITGNINGKRMRTRVSRPAFSTFVSPSYQQTFVKKERTFYNYNILNGDLDNYWGRSITPTPTTMSFTLSGIDFTKIRFNLALKLHGFNVGSHVVNLVLNGNSIGTMTGAGQVPYNGNFTLPTAYLVEGVNSLQMTSSASSSDYSMFDTVSASFARTQLADGHRISFYTDNYRGATLTGFTSPNIRAFETNTAGDPVEVTNLRIQQSGSRYSVLLPSYRGAVMYAFENTGNPQDSGILQSPAVTHNNPSTLATATHNANLVIISYADFMPQALAWANYRRGQGFNVEVVDVADIFDEFNYGVLNANSINNFLQYTNSNWQTAPRYVLLVGDATYDPRNYEGLGYNNLVPTKMVDTVYLTTGSDEALADFNNDGLAEMAIGRIPARTPDDVTNALAKVMRFETPGLQSFNRGAVFAFDQFDQVNGYDFAATSQTLRNELPSSMPTTMVDRGAANSQTTLMNALNNGGNGVYLVNYSGHGSAGVWAASSFFSNSNVVCSPGPNCLSNTNNESIYTLLTCLNGYFLLPVGDSLAENLLKTQTGGAVAVWASTGETIPLDQNPMGQRFYNRLSAGTITRMGDLIRDAKNAIPAAGTDVRFSWALLGDPMLKIRP